MLIIVTGPPASGKSFVAEGLARALRLPLIAKDALKEILFDTVGWTNYTVGQRYNTACIALMLDTARQLLAVGQSCIIECNFRPELTADELTEIQHEFGCELVQVHVDAPPELLIERFAARWDSGSRHIGHHDDMTIARVAAAVRQGAYGPIPLDGLLIRVDTTDFGTVDIEAIARQARPGATCAILAQDRPTITHPWREGDVLANGVRIHYYRSGHGDKPSLVMCHGYTDFGLLYTPLVRDLQAKYDCIMVDARCHGLSEAPRQRNDHVDMAADLAGLIDALALDHPVVLGHSMGSRYVLEAAGSYADKLGGVVLEDPPWREHDDPPRSAQQCQVLAEQMRQGILRWNSQTPEELLPEMRSKRPDWTEELLELQALSKHLLDPAIANRLASPRNTWHEQLARAAQAGLPLLVVMGDPARDALVTEQAKAEACQIAPDATYVRVPDAGHCVRYDNYAGFLRAILPWLQAHYPA